LLQAPPANGTKYTAVELKHFISTKLDNNFPNIAKKTTLAVIVPYLLKVAELHVAGEEEKESRSDAAELARDQLESSAVQPSGASGQAPSRKRKQTAALDVSHIRQKKKPVRALGAGRKAAKKSRNGCGEDDGDDSINEADGDCGGDKSGDKEKEDDSSDDEGDGDDDILANGQKGYRVSIIKSVRKESIGSGRNKKQQLQYLVGWEGYETDDDSWVPATGLECDDLIEIFNASTEDLGDLDSSGGSDSDDQPISLMVGERETHMILNVYLAHCGKETSKKKLGLAEF
jgi:hypothetical protein